LSRFMKVLAVAMMIIGALVVVGGFVDNSNFEIGTGIEMVMGSGCLWLLADIAESVRQK
jgi:hypothetical protein